MADEAGRRDDLLSVLDRMTTILDAFDDDRGLSLSELASRAGLPKSTVSRLVSGLVRQRYLEREGKLIYLGLRLFELGQLAEAPRQLRSAALPVMAELRTVTGETTHLAIREKEDMILIAIVRGRTSAAEGYRTGDRVPVHLSAVGKAVLAHPLGVVTEAREAARGIRWVASAILVPGGNVAAAIALSVGATDSDVTRAALRIHDAARAVERRLAIPE
ncbi:IclR family transcriptional regulator [Mycetocola zhadangensis]|uniref:MarR family transcriptional regulator n=1 Tax=Mycetocola zhadangensis TaxID=1164595 RepID=A0A3L7J4Z9_9MICO|nr:helix-turn-helix domain-containing protein [Mycetocola zhadangensis]RLQ85697.1 MarR family transcriptional regulator [Mycetocola zhadangensis]GGE84917.1 IclR family transcriptional regulator [Mycetocola zhadangensis]